MESDEIEKRLEWLDYERQKANLELKAVKDKIGSLENVIDRQKRTISSRQYDGILEQVKSDVIRQIAELEKKYTPQLKAIEKQQKDDLNSMNKRISEVQSILPLVAEIKKNLQNRIDEENRLSQRIDTINTYFENLNGSVNVVTQESKRIYDDNQVNNKRMADIQVEITALRKRFDDERNRNELSIVNLQKLETNIKSLQGLEAERKQTQAAFIEKTSLAQLERDNSWMSWQEQFDSLMGLGTDFSQKIAMLEATHKAMKQSQTELDDVNLRFDRRINELTEMHRLNEERFRQEWILFKSDDQKRWTNYQLTQEEQQQEDSRQSSKLQDRVTLMEDALQETKESLSLITEETEKQLKAFYSVFHDLIESFEQTFEKK
jgi:chromosome segregation ATPase